MVDLLLLLLIAIQAAVDISRERAWQQAPNLIRINRNKISGLFLPITVGGLFLLGKFYFVVTGLPTVGFIALYLFMLFYFMHAYPYIILKAAEVHICTHAMQPNIVIAKELVTRASKDAHLLRIEYHPENMPTAQRVILDTRSFPDIVYLETWLGLHKSPAAIPQEDIPTKKAA